MASPESYSPEDSPEASNPSSKKKHNVRFTTGGDSSDDSNPASRRKLRSKPKLDEGIFERSRGSNSLRRSNNEKSEDITDETARAPVSQARPSIMRTPSSRSNLQRAGSIREKEKKFDVETSQDGSDGGEENGDDVAKAFSQKSAQDRAERLSRMMGSHSAPGSRYASPHRPEGLKITSPPASPPSDSEQQMPIDLNDLPLEKLERKRTKYGIEDDTEDDEEREEEERHEEAKPKKKQRSKGLFGSAARLLGHNSGARLKRSELVVKPQEPASGTQTPMFERDPDDYVPKPTEYKEGYLSSLLKLYDREGLGSAISHIPSGSAGALRAANRSASAVSLLRSQDGAADTPGQTPLTTPGGSPSSSGATTPKPKHQKWYYKNSTPQSTGALSDLVSSSTMFAQPGKGSNQSSVVKPKPKPRPLSLQAVDTVLGKKNKMKGDPVIEVHMEDLMQRHEYLLKMCRALMSYGAPTHRLEEYMRMSARVLQIDGQFLYIPGCMIISFDDRTTHTTEVKIVRTAQGVNLGKLRDTHDIYKEVIHDVIGVREAIFRLDEVTHKPNKYGAWWVVLMYGFASMCVGPFAFGARPIDLPMAWVLGCLLGILQHIIAPKSDLYTNIFEVSAAVLLSFLARALGSIKGGDLFCFSALTQSAIALILPGYTVLCGSLELQSRNLVAGSVRMVYAIIYSLFLGFGITIGTSFYGGIDKNATSDTSCNTEMSMLFKFLFVPPFTLCLIVINQGKYKQMPVMVVIAFIGYIVNYFSALRFATNAQIANTLGALAIGVLGNLYSRLRHGLAAAALLPAIYVQVPSGLAASGSLVTGITSANQITNKTVNGTSLANGTTTLSTAANGDGAVNSMVFNVGYSMLFGRQYGKHIRDKAWNLQLVTKKEMGNVVNVHYEPKAKLSYDNNLVDWIRIMGLLRIFGVVPKPMSIALADASPTIKVVPSALQPKSRQARQYDACVKQILTSTWLPPGYQFCTMLPTVIPCNENVPMSSCPPSGEDPPPQAPQSDSPTPQPQSPPSGSSQGDGNGSQTGLIIGVVIGGLALLIILIALMYNQLSKPAMAARRARETREARLRGGGGGGGSAGRYPFFGWPSAPRGGSSSDSGTSRQSRSRPIGDKRRVYEVRRLPRPPNDDDAPMSVPIPADLRKERHRQGQGQRPYSRPMDDSDASWKRTDSRGQRQRQRPHAKPAPFEFKTPPYAQETPPRPRRSSSSPQAPGSSQFSMADGRDFLSGPPELDFYERDYGRRRPPLNYVHLGPAPGSPASERIPGKEFNSPSPSTPHHPTPPSPAKAPSADGHDQGQPQAEGDAEAEGHMHGPVGTGADGRGTEAENGSRNGRERSASRGRNGLASPKAGQRLNGHDGRGDGAGSAGGQNP
ncbi:hypothetical protein ACLMJK_006414 [Lecanora helva]